MSPPGRDEYQDFDDEDTIVLAVPEPEFANTRTTEDEKIEAIKKWVLGREDWEEEERQEQPRGLAYALWTLVQILIPLIFPGFHKSAKKVTYFVLKNLKFVFGFSEPREWK
jgi:hypothetical protein